MKLDNLKSVEQMAAFLSGSQAIAFAVATTKDERYQFVESILKRFSYSRLKRQEKGIVIKFLMKVSRYSRPQLTRMISQFVETGRLERRQKTTNGFEKVYTTSDIQLLVEMDKRHDTPNGFMVKKLCERAFHEFGEIDYERLSGISKSHIYNLRKSSTYKNQRHHYEKTKSNKCIHIGERRKPRANGQPGYIRIDTVHQGDYDGCKGVYHINAVDEVTQFEIVMSVEKISENHLIPILTLMIECFPFKIINFHSDNGSEYINATVATLLNKLKIEMTKSRPRTSTDNALAEGKNASIVRKIFGYSHIPQHYAAIINEFNVNALNPYINYHRPCLYPTTVTDSRGKQKKKYRYEDMMTPYDKLKSIPQAERYLKDGMSFEKLDDIAKAMTDNQAADYLQTQRQLLFNHINEDRLKSA